MCSSAMLSCRGDETLSLSMGQTREVTCYFNRFVHTELIFD